MNDERAAVADVGEMRKDLQRLDESLALLAVAFQVEAEHRAAAARQQLLGERMAGVTFELRVADLLDHRMRHQKLHNLARVVDMPRHAQRQGLDALQNQPRGMRAHAGAEVAQALAARTQQERADAALFAEHHAVKALVRRRQLGEAARRVPVETPAVHQHAADDGTVARQELRRRMKDQVSAVLERLHQVRRREGRVDEQRQAVLVRDRTDRRDIEHFEPRVAERLAEQQPRFGPDCGAPAGDVARLDEARRDAEA